MPQEVIKKYFFLELIIEFNNVTGYKIKTTIVFLDTSNEHVDTKN